MGVLINGRKYSEEELFPTDSSILTTNYIILKAEGRLTRAQYTRLYKLNVTIEEFLGEDIYLAYHNNRPIQALEPLRSDLKDFIKKVDIYCPKFKRYEETLAPWMK